MVLERDVVHRDGDDDLVVAALQVLDRDFGPGNRGIVERIPLDARFRPRSGVDKAGFIHEGESFKVEQLPHLHLEFLEVFRIAQVFLGQQADGYVHYLYVVVQVVFHDLLSAACQLVEVQQADGADRLLGISAGAASHPNRAQNQYRDNNDAADYGGWNDSVSFSIHLLRASIDITRNPKLVA